MKKIITILVVALSLSCEKEAMQPETTTTGENTFSFQFNDSLFVPKVQFMSFYDKYYGGPWYVTSSGKFRVGARNLSDFGNYSVSLYIEVDSIFQTGMHDQFNYKEMRFDLMGHGEDEGHNRIFQLDSNQNSWINILQLDTISPVLSASFEFYMLDTSSNETVHIKDGQFDFGDYLKIN